MALRRDWIASPNFSNRSRKARLVVVHTAEGSRNYRDLGAFFSKSSSAVSSQTGIDDTPGAIGEYVRRDKAAWTQASFNSDSIATELCAFAEWDRAEWLTHPVMLENCRQWIAEECAAAGIPLVRIGASSAQGGGSGVCGHVDLGSGGGGHWDPGPEFPWDIVMGGGVPIPPAVPPGLNAAVVGIESSGDGYLMVAADGGVFNYGCQFKGSAGGIKLNAPVVGLAVGRDGGYWLTAADGGVFSYGVTMLGSMGGKQLNKPVTGIAATRSRNGYWLVAEDGGVFSFGDAVHMGSMGGRPLNAPVVDICQSGDGYIMVASDGGVFNYGCPYWGSAAPYKPQQPIVGIDAREDGQGYWLTAADGGVFAFGLADFAGSMGGQKLNWPAVGIAAGSGNGYWIGASDGGVFCFGVPFLGSVQDSV